MICELYRTIYSGYGTNGIKSFVKGGDGETSNSRLTLETLAADRDEG